MIALAAVAAKFTEIHGMRTPGQRDRLVTMTEKTSREKAKTK
jgi:hypothetical protein